MVILALGALAAIASALAARQYILAHRKTAQILREELNDD